MSIFDLKLIKTKVKVPDKKSLFIEMVDAFYQQEIITDQAEFLATLIAREEVMSTGIGFGIGIPHGRHKTVTELKVAVYILENEIEFDALDGLPVKIVFMIAIPVKSNNEYMKVLNLVSKTLHEDQNRVFFSNTEDKQKIFEYLEGLEYET